VQAGNKEAGQLIKNFSGWVKILRGGAGESLKLQNYPSCAARNLTEKKLFLARRENWEKLYTADGGGAAITYPPFLWINLCIRS